MNAKPAHWVQYYDSIEKNKTSKNTNKFIKVSKMPFSTIPRMDYCIATIKREKKLNLS